MSSSALVRWGGLATMLGGALFLGESISVLIYALLDLVSSRIIEILFGLTWLFVAAGMTGFHALQKERYGRVGRAGLYVAVAALLAESLGLTAYFSGSQALLWLGVWVGPLGLLIGFTLYGAATLQARVLPRWCGIAFVVAVPVTVLLLGNGLQWSFIWLGLVWLALGYALWSRRDAPVGHPSHVG